MDFLSENTRLFTSLVGFYAIIWWCIEHLTPLIELIINSIKPYLKFQWKRTLSEEYGQWAGKFFKMSHRGDSLIT